MHLITARNVNDAFRHGMTLLATHFRHAREKTRNGDAYVANEPVTTHYRYPTQRVLWSAVRDANPFFHLLEALWMLGGKRDVKRMAWLVPRMAQYSDDGVRFHAAYGQRWRHWYSSFRVEGLDQLTKIVNELRDNPTSRRVMLSMWSPEHDLFFPPVGAKDLPCNVSIKFEISKDLQASSPNAPDYYRHLNMMVFNRSNDIIMGAYGANAVHLSMLQQYVAEMVGVRVGWYEQISCNWHAYCDEFDPLWAKMEAEPDHGRIQVDDPYYLFERPAKVWHLVTDADAFDEELQEWLLCWELGRTPPLFRNDFFNVVAQPMLDAYRAFRNGETQIGISQLVGQIQAFGSIDWLLAGADWLGRRINRKLPKNHPLPSTVSEDA